MSYRAPTRDGEALISPGIDAAAEFVAANARQLEANEWNWPDYSLAELRRVARAKLLSSATRYSSSYRPLAGLPNLDRLARPNEGTAQLLDERGSANDGAAHGLPNGAAWGTLREPSDGKRPPTIIMAGHQPTLFHPGVWFKNFAIDRIARRVASSGLPGGISESVVAVNLVIDNDVSTASSIRVPFLDPQTRLVRRSPVAYDVSAGGLPYEQNRIQDRETFESFANSVRSAVSTLVADPLIDRLWPHAVAAVGRCENVACAIAQARHALEGELGLQTLELPLSVICRGEPFFGFALAILNQAERFRETYNVASAEYRLAHRIRSSAHPVPDLAIEGGWIEVPFWVYSDSSPQRRRAWVRTADSGLEISDRRELSIRLDRLHLRDPAELAKRFGRSFKLRPRALVTTMFARLVLCDLFVHGIGGAKYDELGDVITARFFGVQPPPWMTVSATMLLPADPTRIARSPWSVVEVRDRIRRARFAPESFAAEVALPEGLCQAKRELIANRPASGSKKDWHDQVDRVNRDLYSRLGKFRERLTADLSKAREFELSEAILRSREHSFCLFPVEHLARHYSRLLQA